MHGTLLVERYPGRQSLHVCYAHTASGPKGCACTPHPDVWCDANTAYREQGREYLVPGWCA